MKKLGLNLLKIVAFVAITIILVVVFCSMCRSIKRERIDTDCRSLRAVMAEAYVNICRDPEFVNIATKGHPMEIPEKYYTCVKSVQGDGRVHVIIYYDGTIDAYFGTPGKNVNYYLGHTVYLLPE